MRVLWWLAVDTAGTAVCVRARVCVSGYTFRRTRTPRHLAPHPRSIRRKGEVRVDVLQLSLVRNRMAIRACARCWVPMLPLMRVCDFSCMGVCVYVPLHRRLATLSAFKRLAEKLHKRNLGRRALMAPSWEVKRTIALILRNELRWASPQIKRVNDLLFRTEGDKDMAYWERVSQCCVCVCVCVSRAGLLLHA